MVLDNNALFTKAASSLVAGFERIIYIDCKREVPVTVWRVLVTETASPSITGTYLLVSPASGLNLELVSSINTHLTTD